MATAPAPLSLSAAATTVPARLRVGRAAAVAPPRRRTRMVVVRAKIREIFMPALSSTMTEGKIVSWTAAEGDRLAKGDPVVVVESDKADMDVETFHDGFLAAVLVPAGESAPVGSAIALLAESEEEIPAAQSKAASLSSSSSSPPPPPPQEATPPPSPPPPPAPVAAVSAPTAPSPATQGGLRVVASPYARKLAKDLNVDLFSITGSGPGGRIVAKDVEAAAAAPKKATPVAAARPDVPLGSTVPFTTMQAAVSKNMVESLAMPTFRVGYTFTTDALDALYKKAGIKPKGVTMSALLAKATAMALVQHPVINSSCRDGKSFTYNSSINIAVAVAIDGGLITPVLPDADKLDIYSLSRKWKELVDKARAKQLQPHEYNSDSYGALAILNIGEFRVLHGAWEHLSFKPTKIHDMPLREGQAVQCTASHGAIMAVGSSQPTLVGTKDGRIGIKNQMQRSHPSLHGGAMAATAASSDRARAEVDTSSAFRSVKEAVAVFGERILVGENHFRRNGGGDRRAGRQGSTRSNTMAIAASFAKLEGGDGVRVSSHSKTNAIGGANAKLEESSRKLPVSSDAAPAMYLIPSSPPFFASSPSLANDDDVSASAASDAMVMGSIRKVEEEAARARQEVVQLKRRLAETELAMATLSAKLHRALSKLAHMEADRAAAERARIQRRDGRDMALAVWTASGGDRRRGVAAAAAHTATARRQPLGQLLRLGEADDVGAGGEVVIGGQRRSAAAAPTRKLQKEKPIVPLIVPLINGIIFSRKKRIKDKESFVCDCQRQAADQAGRPAGSAASACVWAVAAVLLLAVLAGGGCLVLYLALPPADVPHWLPIAGLALVALPWAFWIATCAYRFCCCCCCCSSSSSPEQANAAAAGHVERQPSSSTRPAAVAPLPSGTNLKSAVRSPMGSHSHSGTRRVHFGDSTVLGEKGAGEPAVVEEEEEEECSSATTEALPIFYLTDSGFL
uniref:Dihydrolipoamide acetyltransferase component of pyruvate dehydrogenase complex n=1 Tax=Oryza punctata TaxID=4537 RepID=A0A0E0MKB9_ORYPU